MKCISKYSLKSFGYLVQGPMSQHKFNVMEALVVIVLIHLYKNNHRCHRVVQLTGCVKCITHLGLNGRPFYQHSLIEVRECISNHSYCFLWDVTIHPGHKFIQRWFSQTAAESRAWINTCIPLFYVDAIIQPCPNPLLANLLVNQA